jgi:hypothetical protein
MKTKRSVKQKMEQALLDIGFKDKEAANLHMQVNKLTYKDICTHAEDAYRTGRSGYRTGRSGHLHDTLATPRLHQLHSETWQLQSPELRFSTSSCPSPQPTAPDLPRKESVTSATNLDIGLANALRIKRAKWE